MSASHTLVVSDIAKAVLMRARITKLAVHLPEKLDRKDYMLVDKVLQAAGGKWNKGMNAHVGKPDWTDVLKKALEEGTIPRDKVIKQAFYTPDDVADKLVDFADIDPDRSVTVLEPSCGDGALIRAIRRYNPRAIIQGYDIDPAAAKDKHPGHVHVKTANFLTVSPLDFPFDYAIMNPPFQNWQALQHIINALSFIGSGGTLVSIVPGNFVRVYILYIQETGLDIKTMKMAPLPSGSFKKSGTNIETAMLKVVLR